MNVHAVGPNDILAFFFYSDERFAVIGGGSLQIVNVTEDDAGTYSCQADNGNETIETQAELNVQGGYLNQHLLGLFGIECSFKPRRIFVVVFGILACIA